MPRPSQELKILEAALACFAEHGYDGTRIKQIAQRAGVSEGALYRHYPSKEAVARALFIEHMGDLGRATAAVVAQPLPVEARLGRCAQQLLERYRTSTSAILFVLQQKPQLFGEIPPGFIWPLDALEQLIAEGQREGSLREGQPNLLAAIFLGCLVRPLLVAEYADPGALDLLHTTAHDRTIVAAALAAMARPAAPEAPNE